MTGKTTNNIVYILIIYILFSLYGCANIIIEPFGYIASDREKISPKISIATLPSIAPSISQGYKPKMGGRILSQPVEETNPTVHEGIDIIHPAGTPVLAAAKGIITKSYYEPLYGNHIVVSHGYDEKGFNLITRYLHLDKRIAQEGEHVDRGQVIGTMGRTGLLAAGFSHLHFEIRRGISDKEFEAIPVHPHRYWVKGPGQVTCYDNRQNYPTHPVRTTYPVPCPGLPWEQVPKLPTQDN